MTERRLKGLTMVLTATVLWSTAGLFMRFLHLDVWTILGWRSLFAAAALGLIVLLQKRGASDVPGFATLSTVPIAVVSMGAYVVSLKLTSVANVMVVYATVPLVAAGLAWLALRERLEAATLVASLVALIGVAVMVGGAVGQRDFAGIAIAFAMTLAMGGQIVLARKFVGMNMALVNITAAGLCAIVGLALSRSGIPSFQDLFVLMLFGVSNTALAYYFVLRGARDIPSVEVGLINTLDVVLGPLWVWLIFAEEPGSRAVAGGGVVLVAVIGCLFSQYRQQQRLT